MARQTSGSARGPWRRYKRGGMLKGSSSALFPISIRRDQRWRAEKWMVSHNLMPPCDAVFWVRISHCRNCNPVLSFCRKNSSIVKRGLWSAGNQVKQSRKLFKMSSVTCQGSSWAEPFLPALTAFPEHSLVLPLKSMQILLSWQDPSFQGDTGEGYGSLAVSLASIAAHIAPGDGTVSAGVQGHILPGTQHCCPAC